MFQFFLKCFCCSNESNQKTIRDRSSKVEIGSIESALEWCTDYVRGEKCILDDLSSLCCFLEGATGDHQIIDIKQRVHAVTTERYFYYRHDACAISGRARPPDRQGHMGELDHLMVKMAQVQRRLSRWYQRREVWSGTHKITSCLELDELVVDNERQRQIRRKELSVLWMNGYMEVHTLYIQAQHEVLCPDDGLEHTKMLVGRLVIDR